MEAFGETVESTPPMRGHALFRHVFVPGVLALSVASWVYREKFEQVLRSSAISIDYMSAVLLTLILCIWLAEQAYPERTEWNYQLLTNGVNGWNRLGRDLFYLFVVTQLSALLINATALHLTSRINGLGVGLGVKALWPAGAAFPVRVALVFFTVEFFSYWTHWAAHHFPLLWRFHSTHHVITQLTGFKSLRVHPVENAVFYVARHAPLMFLGVGVEEMLTVTYLCSALGILAHANISVSEGYLGWVVNFPRYHAVHHSSDLAESNSNFGCHTVLWDRVFGTFRSSAQSPLTIGVHPVGPRSLWQELGRPFLGPVG